MKPTEPNKKLERINTKQHIPIDFPLTCRYNGNRTKEKPRHFKEEMRTW